MFVDSICGSGEVRSSGNIDINDKGQCGHRYIDEGRGIARSGESYWTSSEAARAAEQRKSVQVVVNSVCGDGEVRSSANVDVDNNGPCNCQYGD